ncbi:hypothetical protein TNCV_1181481 [Trichonephila clavipes]|nr:hypothetical protein TNCV_1181481 [Trichonephila clavipes]
MSYYYGTTILEWACMHYSAITDDKLIKLTSLVKMWTPQQKLAPVSAEGRRNARSADTQMLSCCGRFQNKVLEPPSWDLLHAGQSTHGPSRL